MFKKEIKINQKNQQSKIQNPPVETKATKRRKKIN
jgi:hypothetical protein